MKKLFNFTILLLSFVWVFAAGKPSIKPSIDGRAQVANEGDMPKGLFAKTIGYLPGDSVSVTNPNTGDTVDVLVLGAIDPSEGVAILLSKEAAEKLNVKKDSNIQVKLTKRTGQIEQSVSGTAVIAQDTKGTTPTLTKEDTPTTPNMSNNTNNTNPNTNDDTLIEANRVVVPETPENKDKMREEKVVFIDDNFTMPDKTPKVPEIIEIPSSLTNEKPKSDLVLSENVIVLDDNVNKDKSSTTNNASTVPTTPTLNSNIPYTEEIAQLKNEPPAPIKEDIPFEETLAISPIEENNTSNTPKEEKVLSEDVVFIVDTPSPNEAKIKETKILEETLVTKQEDAPTLPKKETKAEETLALLEDAPCPPISKKEPTAPIEETVAVLEKEEAPAPQVTKKDEYTPIVLVPSVDNPPQKEKTDSISNNSNSNLPKSNKYESYIVANGFKGLKSGSYYVQIATLGKGENLDNLVTKYAQNYPLVLVPSNNDKAYQVMIGSLNVDEYGVVLERFRNYGFSDAFLRKIK